VNNPFFNQVLNETGPVYEDAPNTDSDYTIPLGSNFNEKLQQRDITGVNPKDLSMMGTAPQVGPSFLESIGPKPMEGKAGNIMFPDKEEAVYTDEFIATLKDAENWKGKKEATGWDSTTKTWFPYESLEKKGGTDTVGYGHKMSPTEHSSRIIKIDGEDVDLSKVGLTEEQAGWLLDKDIEKHVESIRGRIEDFDSFDQNLRSALISVDFQAGDVGEEANQWPKMVKAAREGNAQEVYNQMLSSWKDKKGVKHYDYGRRNKFATALDLLPPEPIPSPTYVEEGGVLGSPVR